MLSDGLKSSENSVLNLKQILRINCKCPELEYNIMKQYKYNLLT